MNRLNCTILAFLLSLLTSYSLSAQIITTVAGNTPYGFDGSFGGDNGPATAAYLNRPGSIALDSIGNLFIADQGNTRIRKVDTAGIIHTIAGNGINGYSGDDSDASYSEFCDMLFVRMYNNCLYIPDVCNHRIRKIDLSTNVITTCVGDGVPICFGDTGTANSVHVFDPFCVDADNLGNLYYSNVCNVVHKLSPDNQVVRVAGTDSVTGFGGNGGPATAAILNHPNDVAHDQYGNMYITDVHNNIIRKVDEFGIITTFAGTGVYNYNGDYGPATAAALSWPQGITCDGADNVFFTDCDNNVVRRIDHNTNIITTVVGCGAGWNVDTGGFSGDGGPATAAKMYHPAGLTFDKDGNLYIADWLNNRVRKVTNVGIPLSARSVEKQTEEVLKVYPNPTTNKINIKTGSEGEIQLFDLTGRLVRDVPIKQTSIALSVDELPSGVYVVVFTNTSGNKRYAKFVRD